jgi:hypothetical protein
MDKSAFGEPFESRDSRLDEDSEGGLYALVRLTQLFRQDTGFRDYRHEVCIADPARNDVQVEVFSNSRSRCLAKIHPNIESIRIVNFLQCRDCALREVHHFRELFWVSANDRVTVLVWRNHQMSGRIRKEIQDNEIVIRAEHDQARGVAARVIANAEDASRASLPV